MPPVDPNAAVDVNAGVTPGTDPFTTPPATGGYVPPPGTPTGNVALEQQIQNTYNPFLTQGMSAQGSQALDAATAAFQQQMLPMLQNQMTLSGVSESPLATQAYGNALGQQLVPLITADMQARLQAGQQAAALSGQQFQQGFAPWQAEAQGRLTREQMAQEKMLQEAQQAIARAAEAHQFQLGQSGQALERELGLGSQGVTREGQQLQYQAALGGQGVQRELGLGNIALERQLGLGQQGITRELGLGNLALGGRQLSQQGAMNAAQIAAQQRDAQLRAYGLAGNLALGMANPYQAAMQGQMGQQQTGLNAFGQFGSLGQNTAQQVYDQQRQDYLRQQGLAESASSGVFGGSIVPPSLAQTSGTTGSTSK